MRLTLEAAADAARRRKESAEWDDLIPVMLIERKGKRDAVVVGLIGDEGPMPWELVRRAIESHQPVASVVLTVDGYAQTIPKGGAMLPPPARGDLARAWAEGRRDGLTEMMTVAMARPDGSVDMAYMPYDAEARTWGEPRYVEGAEASTIGGMIDVLVGAMVGRG